MITEQQAYDHWTFLEESSEQHGRLEALVKAKEHLVKQYKAQAFLSSSGTVAERESKAEIDGQVARARNEYENAVAEQKTLWAKRKAAELAIHMWQTLSANTRQNVVL